MTKKKHEITNNGKDGSEFKEYLKIVYWCKKDDIWIGVETPLENDHAKYHSSNAFCGYAGQEERQHLRDLIKELTNEELKQLVNNVNIYFLAGEDELDRENYESVIDEADREDFYREYNQIINSRKKQ